MAHVWEVQIRPKAVENDWTAFLFGSKARAWDAAMERVRQGYVVAGPRRRPVT
jgi:hypothetical protein